jgi:hypothetical protein
MRRIIGAVVALTSLAFAGAATAAVEFDYTGSITTWVVPETGTYQIFGAGAQGGIGGSEGPGGQAGGLGAEVGGLVSLQAGEVLSIVVGGMGSGNGVNDLGGGGGGATWLFVPGGSNPLLVAGGGGGNTWFGGIGAGGAADLANPGSGAGGSASLAPYSGGGGAGWLSPGGDGGVSPIQPQGTGGQGPNSFAGGYTTGNLDGFCCINRQTGGFGGGGGAGFNFGGGGGGYTGGSESEGGTSYLSPGFVDVTANSGVQTGSGVLTINFLSATPEPPEWALFGVGALLVAAVLRRKAQVVA